MTPIRINKTIDSDTLTIPELKEMIGRTVSIVIEEQPTAAAVSSGDFWAFAAKPPTTEAEFATQQETFRAWRTDPRYEVHWPMIELLLARDFERTRKWAVVSKAAQELTDCDYDAARDQDARDLRDAQERLK